MSESATASAMDDLSISSLVSCQLEDVDALLRQSKGKHPEGKPPDMEVALVLYRDELLKHKGILEDRCMAESFRTAVQMDGPVIATARMEEAQAIQDRELARRLAGDESSDETPLEDSVQRATDNEIIRQICTLLLRDYERTTDHTVDLTNPSSSSSPTVGKGLGKSKQCVACQENKPISDCVAVACSHDYCRACISELFKAAITDESLFPPRCCGQVIPFGSVKAFLSAALLRQFEAKEIELKTPNRTYCVWPTCSTFIPEECISGDVATCQECQQTTCTLCKRASHDGDCPSDSALQSLRTTATVNGWQSCYACNRVVELEFGCNHISCICRAEFCYLCGKKWKTCPCPLWNEDRLVARATQAARRANPRNDMEEQQLVERAAENLRERHECMHPSWMYVRPRGVCERCSVPLPLYQAISECKQCHIQVCCRCQINRLF